MANEWSQELLNEINRAGQEFEEAALSGNPRIPDNVRQQVAENVFYRYYQQQQAEREANHGRTAHSYLRDSVYNNVVNPVEYSSEELTAARNRVSELQNEVNRLKAAHNSPYVSEAYKSQNKAELENKQSALALAQQQQERMERDTARARQATQRKVVDEAAERGVSYKGQYEAYGQSLKEMYEQREQLRQQLSGLDKKYSRANSDLDFETRKRMHDEEKESTTDRLEKLTREIERLEGQRNYASSNFGKDKNAAVVIKQGEELARTLKEQYLAGNIPDPTSNADYRAWADSNTDKTARDYAEQQYADREPNDLWTQDEKNRYFTLMTMNPESAFQYAVEINSAINREVNERAASDFSNLFPNYDMSKEAREGRSGITNALMWAGNAASDVAGIAGGVATGPVKLFNWLDNIYQNNERGGYYAGNNTPRISDYTDQLLNQNTERLNSYGTINNDVPVLGGKGLGDLYQLVESVAQSMTYGAGLSKAFGVGATTAAGIKAAQQAAKLSTGLIFFGQAADSSYNEYVQRGMSREQAAVGSFFAGLAEAAGEELSIDHLISGDISEGLAKYVAKQSLIEASEEGFTDVLNQFGDALAAKITGGETKMQQDIEALKRGGMTEEDAKRQVWKQFVDDTVFDMLGGAFSGGLSAGITGGANRLWEMRKQQLQNKPSKQSDKSLASMFNKALERGELETARLIQEEMKKRYPSANASQGAQQNGETVEQGEKFGKRILKERSAKEPEVNDAIKGLFELSNENFAGAMSGYGDQAIRDAYEWALWNDEFTKANILRDIADKRGISLEEQNAQHTAQKPAEQQEERPPMPESENEAAAPEGYEGQQNERGNPFHATPEAKAAAQNVTEDVRQALFDEFQAAQNELKNNPDLANDMEFLRRLNDLFNRASAAVKAANGPEATQNAVGEQQAPEGQITQPNQQNAAQTVKPGNSEQKNSDSRPKLEEGQYYLRNDKVGGLSAEGIDAVKKAYSEEFERLKNGERHFTIEAPDGSVHSIVVGPAGYGNSGASWYIDPNGLRGDAPYLSRTYQGYRDGHAENKEEALAYAIEIVRFDIGIDKDFNDWTFSLPSPSLTTSTESGTMSVPNTQEVTTNAGEQTVSGEEGTGSGAGVQRDSSAEGRATDNANQSEVEQPGQLQDNREVPEGSGRDAEGTPADTVVSRGAGNSGENRPAPKWVKLKRHIDAIKSGNWFGKRHNVKAGRNALDPAYDPRGKLRPGTNVTSNFSVEIDQPDIGTVAHLMRNIMDVFGVKRNNGHIYTRAFDIVGDNGSPSGLRSKGCSGGSKVAVSINQNGTLEEEMEGLINTAHECGHFRIQDKYGPAAATVNVGKNGEITVGRRAEAAWRIAQNALIKVGSTASEAKVLLDKICDYWLDEHGENYRNIYINNGVYADYAKHAGNDANLLQEMLRKHVVEEFLVESIAHSPILSNAVTNVSAVESAVMQAMLEDGVLTQEQVDILQEMREAMDAKDFLPTSTDVTKAESGYYYSNVTEDQDVDDIEHNEVARRSKRNVPIEGSEKAQFQYRLDNTSESQAEKEFVSNRATKPKKNKPKNTHVETVTHSSVTDAANSILGQSLVFEGGKDSGMPDVIALDSKGTTYTVPGTVKSSIKQIKKLVKGIAVGSHPMRSISELVDLYDSFNKSGNDMKAFTTKEIQQSIDDIKNIASSRTMSDNQKIMALENATVKTLNLISAQMNRVNMSFKSNLEFAKLMSKLPKSQKLESQKKIQSFIDKAFSWQANPTTLFKMMGGFSKTSGNIGYQFARQIQQNTIKYEMLFTEANSKYHELSKMDGYSDFARDKKMCPVKLGDMQLTEQEAIDFIKRVTTLEKTVIGGQRRIDSIKGFAVQQKDGSYKYIEKKAAKQSWIELRDQMMDSLSSVAKKYLEITGDVMHTLGQSVSETKKNITGVGFWTMDKGIYYPLQYHSPSQDTQAINDDDDVAYFGPTGESVAQSRTRENGGYVIVRPASQTVDSYIEKASNYAAYGDLANQLYLMDNIGAGMTGLSNLVGINFGKDYARAVHNYVNDINNKKTGAPRAIDNLLKKGRSHLQRGALRFSVSVPLKQAPSYWTAMGALSPDAVLKSWRMKAFMPSANYSKGDPIVAYRKIGGIDPTVSEALNNKSFISALKSKSKIIEIWDNAITNIDVKTVDNLFKATVADTVQNYPDIPRDSKLFSDIVTAKFREVVLDSQPTYVKNARSEYQRTDDETIRILSMFRTQQTQNLNNIVTAIGEFRAAKGTVREAAMAQRLKGTIAGQVISYIEFGLLSTLADFALHRKKKYKDDEDEWDAKKTATRVGLNILESAAGTLWFGDEVTKAVADAISKANKGDLNEFYGVSLGPISTLTSVWDSFENFLSNRSVSNLQKLVSNVSQAFGVPVGNAYRVVNSAVMWSLDFMNTVDPTIGNRAGYDDITKVFDAYRKGTLEVEGAKLQATKAFKRGNTENLLYNLGILSEHGNDGENKGADWLNTRIQGKTEEERKAYKEDELARLGRNLNAGERIANYLADSALSAAQKDEAISKFATTSGYNVLYESLRAAGMTPKAAVAELGKTDNKTGMETNITSDKSLESLYAGEVKPGNGTDNDIPKLEKSNTDEYVNFVSAMKVFEETGNYSQLDKLVDQYSKLDANTRAVVAAKDSTMKNYLEYRAMGLSTKDYYNVKDAIKQAQIDLDLSANTGTTVKLVGLSRANLTKAQMKKLIESESLGISKTGKSLISVLEKYGYTIGEIGEFMYNTDWTNDDADGTLRQQEVVLALSKEKRLTEPQRIAIYEELKELLRNEGKINHWYDKSYEYELNYLLQNGKTSGRT